MKYVLVTAAMAFALAGCGSGVSTESADSDGDGEVSLKEAGDAVKNSGLKPQPGKYRVTSDMGGMKTNAEYCLTKEDAEKGFEEMMTEGQQGDCKYEKFELANGKLDAVAVCKTEMGDMRMEMAGDVSSTSSDLEMTMKGNVGGMNMDMTVNAKQERIGDCDEGDNVAP